VSVPREGHEDVAGAQEDGSFEVGVHGRIVCVRR
jgi:hypothetical protein